MKAYRSRCKSILLIFETDTSANVYKDIFIVPQYFSCNMFIVHHEKKENKYKKYILYEKPNISVEKKS